jgi:hypothetical protein
VAFWTLALGAFLSAWFVAGCGEVTERPELQPDALAPELGQVDGGRDASVLETTAAADGGATPESPPPCSAAAGCASCTEAGGTAGGFVSVPQCAAVISCVRAGGQGAYPWQDCANMHGASLAGGGLACAQGLVRACP